MVLFFGILATLLTTTYHLVDEYRQNGARFQEALENIEKSVLPLLGRNVWTLDHEQVGLQLEGLVNRPEIAYAAVLTDNSPQWQAGSKPRNCSKHKEFTLYQTYRDRTMGIGVLQVVADMDLVYAEMVQHATSIFLTQLFEIFLFSGLLLVLLYKLVVHRLIQINTHIQQLSPETDSPPLSFPGHEDGRQDELDSIAATINSVSSRSRLAFRDLNDRERKLRLFFDASREGVFSVDAGMRLTFVNSACAGYMGCQSPEEPVGHVLSDYFRYSCQQDNVQDRTGVVAEAVRTGTPVIRKFCLLQLPEGQTIPVSLRAYPLRNNEEQCYGAVVFFNDESRQMALEHELYLLGEAINQSPVVVAVSDFQGRISYVNPGFERITGYSKEEILGQRPFMLDSDREELAKYSQIRKTLDSGAIWRGQLHVVCSNGTGLTLATVITPVDRGDGKNANLVIVSQDVTGEIALRQQLYHAQKMEAIGRLAASIAHEFGNPLFGIRCLLQDLQHRRVGTEEDLQSLDVAVAECDRIKELIRSLRMLHQSGEELCVPLDINKIILRLLTLHEQYLSIKNINCHLELMDGLPPVRASENQLIQVVVNLLLNARDAVSDIGGIITISTSLQGNMVIIRISDNGHGIPEALQERVFEPFFSTKPEVEGTGLGLSVSYGILAGLGGELKLESSTEHGTIFAMILPCWSDDE